MVQTLEQRVRWAERKDKDKDPVEFLRENFPEDIRRKQVSILDSALYKILSRHGRLDEAIPDFDEEASKRGKIRYDPDVAHYKKHYRGRTRYRLQIENRPLYERLWKKGLLDNVPTVTESKFGSDPLAYYLENCNGIPRGQLSKENRPLYRILRNEGLLKFIPTERNLKK